MKNTLVLSHYWQQAVLRRKQALVASVAIALSLGLWQASAAYISTVPAPTVIAGIASNPYHLTDADRSLYALSFNAEERGDTANANMFEAKLGNRQLLGYLLAKRYLGKNYTATAQELQQWLILYSDHPQARDIARLAIARGAHINAIPSETPLKGDGYADHLGRSSMPDGWYRGLTFWREQNYKNALPLFAKIGETKDLSDWQRSAGYYWAYRASARLGEKLKASEYLASAAQYPTTFYGLIATSHFGTPSLKASAPAVAHSLRQSPAAIRASLLAQLDRREDAEDELRYLYGASDKEDRAGIITLAHELSLPNLQVRLARMPNLSDAEKLFASYPLPQTVTEAQDDVSPSLMLAIARSESSFRDGVASRAGAVGMMQMLPSTARAIERRVSSLAVASNGDVSQTVAERLTDPSVSVRYSAEYLKILMKENAVGNNLVRVLASYNAGPGNVSGWSSAARKMDNDPLLYIESIPYAETRNYVMQVLSQYWVYDLLQGRAPHTLASIKDNQWPTLVANR